MKALTKKLEVKNLGTVMVFGLTPKMIREHGRLFSTVSQTELVSWILKGTVFDVETMKPVFAMDTPAKDIMNMPAYIVNGLFDVVLQLTERSYIKYYARRLWKCFNDFKRSEND